jgi:cell division protein FtsB
VAKASAKRRGKPSFPSHLTGLRDSDSLQIMKILIGVLALSTIVLGILCAVQTKQLRATQAQARAVEAALRADARSHETQAARVNDLERANQRLEQQCNNSLP